MKLKPIVASLCLLGMATAGTALAASNNASVNAQIKSLQKQITQLQSKVNNMNNAPVRAGASNVMSMNANLSQQMLSNQAGVGREMNLLNARQAGSLANQSLTLGGRVEADAINQHTNNAGYFSSPLANQIGSSSTGNIHQNSVGHLALSNVNLDSAVALNSWTTGYVQLGSYNVGQATVGQTSPTIQDAYLVLGNLAQSPVYGFAGRKEIDFGSFASVQPYAQPLTRIYFMPTGNTAGVGYTKYGVDVTASLMNGGNNARTVESYGSITQYQNLYTANTNGINNYALNASYSAMNQGVNWTVGAGYLNGVAQQGTATPAKAVGAWDLNAKASLNNFDLLAEFVSTVRSAASLSTGESPAIAGLSTNFPAAMIRAYDLEGDYKFPVMGYNTVAALGYSKVLQGSSAWNAYQYAASWSVQPFSTSNVWAGVTYAYNKGLVGGALAGTAYLPNGSTAQTVTGLGSSAVNNTVLLDLTAYF